MSVAQTDFCQFSASEQEEKKKRKKRCWYPSGSLHFRSNLEIVLIFPENTRIFICKCGPWMSSYYCYKVVIVVLFYISAKLLPANQQRPLQSLMMLFAHGITIVCIFYCIKMYTIIAYIGLDLDEGMWQDLDCVWKKNEDAQNLTGDSNYRLNAAFNISRVKIVK